MSSLAASFILSAQNFAAPLFEELSSPEGIEHLFYRHGWRATVDDDIFAQIDTALGLRADLDDFFAAVAPIREALSDPDTDLSSSDLLPLLESFGKVVERIATFDSSALQHLPAPLGDGAAWSDILDALFDGLLEDYLRIYHPLAHLVLTAAGVLDHIATPASDDRRIAAVRSKFDWDQLSKLISDPAEALRKTYHWNEPNQALDTLRLFDVLHRSFAALRLVPEILYPSVQLDPQTVGGSASRIAPEREGLRTTVLRGLLQDNQINFELGFDLWPIALTPGADDVAGLLMVPRVIGGADASFPLSDLFTVKTKMTVDAGGPLALLFEPTEARLGEGAAGFAGSLSIEGSSDEPWRLFGSATGARIEVHKPMLRAELKGSTAGAELVIVLGSAESRPGLYVIIPLGEADSFVRTVATAKEARFSLDPQVQWSTSSGFAFNGSLLPQVTIPANIALGPITLQQLTIGIEGRSTRAGRSGVSLRTGLSLKGKLGPLEIVVQDIGFTACATPYSREELGATSSIDGDFQIGSLAIDFGFAGPKGIGVRIDASAVSGGGFLLHDEDQNLYAGAFELTLATLSVKAIVILRTRVDGAPFALLAMVYARWPGGIELGFRFTLNAVGGMIGINHRFDYQALVEALPSGAMDAILFPENPVADAPRILTSLTAVCPVQPGAYTLMLMAELGWGSDYICALRLGIILPLDDMRRIYLVGQVRVQCFRHLPETIRLQLICDTLGEIGFDPFSIRIDGRLRDSRFGPIGIEGQLVLLLQTGSDARFLIAAGGFHPNFKSIPAGLPSKIDRLAVNYDVGAFKAWFQGYFAVAAGTVQFGAEIGCRYKAGSISFTGNLGIDALIHLDPFMFEAEAHFNVAVEYHGHELFGVHVNATLWGPDQWRVKGHGSFSILFWDVGIDFDESWGDDVAPAAEPVILLQKAQEDLQNDTYWLFEAPAAATSAIQFATGAAVGAAVHPLTTLSYRQRRFPFGLELDRIGSAPVEGPRSVPVPAFIDPSGNAIPGTPALDPFAVGEYVELSDEARLSRPSFEQLPSGATAGISGYSVHSEGTVAVDVDYEQIFLPHRTKFNHGLDLADLHAGLIRNLVSREAAGLSQVRAQRKLARDREPVASDQPTWTASDPLDLTTAAGDVPAWAERSPSVVADRRKDKKMILAEAFELAA